MDLDIQAQAQDQTEEMTDLVDQMFLTANSKELYLHGIEFSHKVRKPYTITKQRQKWSEEEHKKFIEALRLYGRAWRRVEGYVGTKTAVQIRSHAQKFFSKVVRESGSEEGSVKAIEIPPPRPKRKPVHPYPRKLIMPSLKAGVSERPGRSPSPNFYVSEDEQQSPTSVLSSAMDQITTTSSIPSTLSPFTQSPMKLDCPREDSDIDIDKENPIKEKPIQSLKLFGKTVFVTDFHEHAEEKGTSPDLSAGNVVLHLIHADVDSSGGALNFPLIFPIHVPVANKAAESSMSGQTEYEEIRKDGYWAGSNTSPLNLNREVVARSQQRRPEKLLKGFVPYKRRVS